MKALFTTLSLFLLVTLFSFTQYVGTDPCDVPSIFTPNEDGSNDFLKIPCLEGAKNDDAEIIIYNEWGDRVFSAKPYRNDWQGTYRNQPLPDGTYFYLFREKQNIDFKRGYVTIFR
jgi:gliding motility-associated-like protein